MTWRPAQYEVALCDGEGCELPIARQPLVLTQGVTEHGKIAFANVLPIEFPVTKRLRVEHFAIFNRAHPEQPPLHAGTLTTIGLQVAAGSILAFAPGQPVVSLCDTGDEPPGDA